MLVLGIETSCDECSASVVEDGKKIISNVITTQIDFHKEYYGVVPEIASRLHTEWITSVVKKSLDEAELKIGDIDAFAVTSRPGLIGSLMVGLAYAKGLAYVTGKPFVAVDHIKAHIYAAHLAFDIPYPYLGLIVSGGHTLIVRMDDYDTMKILGTTIDDACGEAFDKVAKFYDMGYPGGVVIDRLSSEGDPKAFCFPKPNLHKTGNPYDVSYSGLKTAVINQIDQFNEKRSPKTNENIAASFQKTAIDILVSRLRKASKAEDLTTIVAGGGVSANSYLRKAVGELKGIESFFPPLKLCTDNGAMIAGLGYHYLKNGSRSGWDENVLSRVVSKVQKIKRNV